MRCWSIGFFNTPPLQFTSLTVSLAFHLPGFVEMRVLDGLGSWITIHILWQVFAAEMITIAGVQAAVLCLDDAGIMVTTGFRAGLVSFEISFPSPTAPFVIRDLHGEAGAP